MLFTCTYFIKGFGKSTLEKIDEIIQTGKLEKAAFIPESVPIKRLFKKIHGVGDALADEWSRRGYRTLEDLRKNKVKLTADQEIGLKYFEEFQIRIPREECSEILGVIEDVIKKVDASLECQAMGSYRRYILFKCICIYFPC